MSDSSFHCENTEGNPDFGEVIKENNRPPQEIHKKKLSCLEIFRTLVNNQKSTGVFWQQAFLIIFQNQFEERRKIILLTLWVLTIISYWIMCLFRAASSLSFFTLHIALGLGVYLTICLLEKSSMNMDKEQNLPDFIIDLCNQFKFEEIDVQRANFNFEMMIVSKEFEKIHTHSVILGKLITARNSRLYLMNMICTLTTSLLWLNQCILASRKITQGSIDNTFFYLFDAIFSLFSTSKILFVFPMISIMLIILISLELLVFCTAVHRQLTLRQLRNLAQPKYHSFDDEDLYSQAAQMKNNLAIYDVIRFKKEGGPDQVNINKVRKRANKKRNLPDDEFDGAIWIRKYRDITFTGGLRNFANFLWHGDPNKRKQSDLDNLIKDASNVKNVESVISSSAVDEKSRVEGGSKRFQEIQFVDLEQDTHRTYQANTERDGEQQENECTTETGLNQQNN